VKLRLIAGLVALVLVAGVALAVLLLRDGGDAAPGKAARTAGPTATVVPDPDASVPPAHTSAISRTVEDSVYPNVGDPGVDALHYHLDLAWEPVRRHLEGTATIRMRATRSAEEFRLDLGDPLEVDAVRLDGTDVEAEHNGKDLVVKTPVVANLPYELVVEYSGLPEPVAAPSSRADFQSLGWTVSQDGAVWTMQEPYGAFTWYPVNDQPADKAFYDFTIRAPRNMVGVANGELVSQDTADGRTVTRFHMDRPVSSYLVTIAIDDYVLTEERSASGVPLTYWTPRGEEEPLEALRHTSDALAWLEAKLGRYPFSMLGGVVVDGLAAMETQGLPTYGNNAYALSPEVVLHEIAHQWYGDVVSPSDWRDMWMNEGMAMYLQGIYQSETEDIPLTEILDGWASPAYEPAMREQAGPPGAYDPTMFGEGNVYYGPALMWHELREKIGDDRFWRMVRVWPTVHAYGNATREQYLSWVEEETGEELSAFFDAWLMGPTSPPR
jgi:aminopeptidase N